MLKLTATRRVGRRVLLAGQKVSRKYREAMTRRHAYRKLKSIVPSIAKQERVSKLKVIKETIKYIDELHQELIKRAPSLFGKQYESLPTASTPEEFVQLLLSSAPVPLTTPPCGNRPPNSHPLLMTSSCACAVNRRAMCTTCILREQIARRNL